MMSTPLRACERISRALALPASLMPFFDSRIGREYGVGWRKKLWLLRRFRRNTRWIQTASTWLEHAELAKRILSIPPSKAGAVVECGCFKGGSTANLSLVCSLLGRKLIVCDSFEGLPEPTEEDTFHTNLYRKRHRRYEVGQFAGRLDEVQANVERYGALEVCEFVPGYFDQTLPALDRECVLAFVDVDLHESLKSCLRFVWPLLRVGGFLYTHESQDLPYVSLFFDQGWWAENLQTNAPGLIGAGSGLPLSVGRGSGLGYIEKIQDEEEFGAVGSEYTAVCGETD